MLTLTRRGRIAAVAALLVGVALIWLLLDTVTPDECKVATEQMSAACQRMMQP